MQCRERCDQLLLSLPHSDVSLLPGVLTLGWYSCGGLAWVLSGPKRCLKLACFSHEEPGGEVPHYWVSINFNSLELCKGIFFYLVVYDLFLTSKHPVAIPADSFHYYYPALLSGPLRQYLSNPIPVFHLAHIKPSMYTYICVVSKSFV